jgi:hypothetical protein
MTPTQKKALAWLTAHPDYRFMAPREGLSAQAANGWLRTLAGLKDRGHITVDDDSQRVFLTDFSNAILTRPGESLIETVRAARLK